MAESTFQVSTRGIQDLRGHRNQHLKAMEDAFTGMAFTINEPSRIATVRAKERGVTQGESLR
jgi:hypothetical protein